MSGAESIAERIDAIVIGASAGGVEALSAVLCALPAGLRATVFVVLHLPREGPSLLVDIFSPRCSLPVREVRDKEPVSGGTIYVAAPDYHLLLDEGPRLALSVDDPVNYSRPSIDVLFESAADVYGDRLMGIILSGGNDDGAAGLRSVQRNGGIAVVQDPASAQVPVMPAAALKCCQPDYVLALDQIAILMQSLARGEKKR
jgi:two-component system chemotaxis response regulator CheB